MPKTRYQIPDCVAELFNILHEKFRWIFTEITDFYIHVNPSLESLL